ncbi:unnamed protein product [Rodentolepis nana]|uniref:G-patch domain-containing protein n=1 Tax=Rodentolepis nana TaxID=102285 RepID=A0A0R3TRE6_RODNA|nr:unnamed protein product [Rodentolepis nana]
MPKGKSSQVIISKGAAITDDSNVGMQLLKKMGWTKDTGLGKEGNGILEPVKASSNFGRKGLGKVSTQANMDMVQQTQFEYVLQKIQSTNGNVASSSDEEEEIESKTRRPRLCYGRYLRDKDISKCDDRSLKVILGKSVAEPEDLSFISPSSETVEQVKDSGHDFGVKTYSSSTDLKSYFAEKMKAKRCGQTAVQGEHLLKRSRDHDGSPNSPEISYPLFNLDDVKMSDASKHSGPSDTGSSINAKSIGSDVEGHKGEFFLSCVVYIFAFIFENLKNFLKVTTSKFSLLYTVLDDSSSSSSSDELSEQEETPPPRPDSPDIFVNSNILSLKGYPYY